MITFVLNTKMEVRSKRNKPFVCDQCGEVIKTGRNYSKIIFVNFVGKNKYRNKFCSIHCFDKWKLINKKPTMNQEPLEEELKNSAVYEKEAYLEEEEPLDIPMKEDKEKKEKNDKEKVKKPFRVEPLNILSKDDIDKINYGRRYDVRGSVQKKPKYTPKHKLKAFLDTFNILKLKYNKDEYK
jgi:hypothetical protein